MYLANETGILKLNFNNDKMPLLCVIRSASSAKLSYARQVSPRVRVTQMNTARIEIVFLLQLHRGLTNLLQINELQSVL